MDVHGDPLPAGAVVRLGTTRLRHGGVVPAVAYSPDGKVLASGGDDGFVRVWDPSTGRELGHFQGHAGPVRSLAFAPNGKFLASGGDDHLICFWDLDTVGKTGIRPGQLHGHTGSVQSLVFTPDSKHLISGSWDQSVRVWELATVKELRRFGADKGRVRAIALSPDGKRLASAGHVGKFPFNASIHLWDPATGKHLGQLGPVLEKKEIYDLAFSPDGQTLAAAADGRPYLYDLASGKDLLPQLQTLGGMFCVAFSPDGKTLACGSSGNFQLVDVKTGKRLRSLETGRNYAYAAAFSPDGKTVATSGTRSVTLWDPATGKKRLDFPGHLGEVSAVLLCDRSQTVITGGYGPPLYLWDLGTGQSLRTLQGAPIWNHNATLSPDGKTLVVQGTNLTLRLIDTKTGKETGTLEGHKPPGGRLVHANMPFAFAPDGRTLATSVMAPLDRTIRLWDLATGKEVQRFTGLPRGASALAYSPDGKTLASTCSDGTVILWDLARAKERHRTSIGPSRWMTLAFSPDGYYLAVTSQNRVHLFEASTGRQIRIWEDQREPILALAFSPDGYTLASATEKDRTVALWEVASGYLRLRVKGHKGPVKAVAFTSDGKLITGSEDTTALVWDLETLALAGVAPLPVLRRQEIEELYTSLGGDASGAYGAQARLRHAPRQVVPFLRERLEGIVKLRLSKLIADLNSDEFLVREKASAELAALGPRAEAALRRILEESPSAEVQNRARRLLARLGKPGAGKDYHLLRVRSLELLERIGTPEARKALEELSEKEDLPEELMRLAREGVKRLAKKHP